MPFNHSRDTTRIKAPTTMTTSSPNTKLYGKVVSLRENNYGFITCAFPYANGDLFFHRNDVINASSRTPEVGDEVEFEMSSSNRGDCAIHVRVLDSEKGECIEWEIKVMGGVTWSGYVVKPLMLSMASSSSFGNGNNSSSSFGLIRVRSASDEEGKVPVKDEDCETVRFLELPKKRGSSVGTAMLKKGDFVEFSIVFEKQAEQLLAKNLVLIQSEKQRLNEEREAKMIHSASRENGIVTQLSKNRGLIKSSFRREPVHFTFSDFSIEGDNEVILEIGQEVEFLAFTEAVEESFDHNRRDRSRKQSRFHYNQQVSARQITLLPKGSVQFFKTVASDVEGMLMILPRTSSNYNTAMPGSIQLKNPLLIDEIETSEVITEVLLMCADIPGGIQPANPRDKNSLEMWIKKGDILRFDVELDIVEKIYRAVGRKVEGMEPRIHLISPNLIGRSEGIIQSIKKTDTGFVFGFITSVDDEVNDVYFRLDDFLPQTLAEDIYLYELEARVNRNNNDDLERQSNAEEGLKVGDHVSFDFMHNQQERGQNKPFAQRLVQLPKVHQTIEKCLFVGAKATVLKENKLQGTFTLKVDDNIETMTNDERYPNISHILKSFHHYSKDITFPKTFSHKKNQAILAIAKNFGLRADFCDTDPTVHSQGFVRVYYDDVKVDNPNQVALKEEKSENCNTKRTRALNPIVVESHIVNSKEKIKSNQTIRVGDNILCDIFQSKRTGKVSAKNIVFVSKRTGESEENTELESFVGIVADLVKNKPYGFINKYNDDETREKIFFHMNDIVVDGKIAKSSRRNRSKSLDMTIDKGDEVRFNIIEKNGKRNAINITCLPAGTVELPIAGIDNNPCRGIILMEPSHTSLNSLTGSSKSYFSSNSDKGNTLISSRWDNADKSSPKGEDSTLMESGRILLVFDPGMIFTKKPKHKRVDVSKPTMKIDVNQTGEKSIDTVADAVETGDKSISIDETSTSLSNPSSNVTVSKESSIGTHVLFKEKSNHILRRGDLVSFSKGKNGVARNIRLVKKSSTTNIHGTLKSIDKVNDNAILVDSDSNEFSISLSEIISCDIDVLQENEDVEGLLHEDKIYGVSRVRDLYLKSTLKNSDTKRQQLNLDIKQDFSKAKFEQAKGPDGTSGFLPGWTTRKSNFETFTNKVSENNGDFGVQKPTDVYIETKK